jgi:Fe2+ or Zn2+ uptake regulation protein
MNDYQVICFNGANRTKDKETTDLTAIHPISKNSEEFVKSFCFKNNINFLGGVALAEHHDHLICTQCGKIEEFNDATIEHCQDKIAEKFGYKLTDHSLYLYGICGDCQAPGAQKK